MHHYDPSIYQQKIAYLKHNHRYNATDVDVGDLDALNNWLRSAFSPGARKCASTLHVTCKFREKSIGILLQSMQTLYLLTSGIGEFPNQYIYETVTMFDTTPIGYDSFDDSQSYSIDRSFHRYKLRSREEKYSVLSNMYWGYDPDLVNMSLRFDPNGILLNVSICCMFNLQRYFQQSNPWRFDDREWMFPIPGWRFDRDALGKLIRGSMDLNPFVEKYYGNSNIHYNPDWNSIQCIIRQEDKNGNLIYGMKAAITTFAPTFTKEQEDFLCNAVPEEENEIRLKVERYNKRALEDEGKFSVKMYIYGDGINFGAMPEEQLFPQVYHLNDRFVKYRPLAKRMSWFRQRPVDVSLS